MMTFDFVFDVKKKGYAYIKYIGKKSMSVGIRIFLTKVMHFPPKTKSIHVQYDIHL